MVAPSNPPRRLALGFLVAGLTLVVLSSLAYFVWSSSTGKLWVKTTLPNPLAERGRLDARAAFNFFDLGRIGQHFQYDPVAYLVPRPDTTDHWDWPEHPAGKIVLRTNEQGFREDDPVETKKRGLRVLVAGDSHTGGLVSNEESFANVLERLLSTMDGAQGAEVINAGVAFTGPTCYLGILRKYLYLDPDVFIAVLFTGNDFSDDLRLRYVLDGWSLPRPGGKYRERLRSAANEHLDGLTQGFNQAYRWKHFPREKERSLEIVIDAYKAIQDLCEENGIEFLAVVLPTKMDVDDDDHEARENTRKLLGLASEDIAVNRKLGLRFASAMQAADIFCLDPTEAMKTHNRPLYWSKDYHLSTEGHAFLAGEILRKLRR